MTSVELIPPHLLKRKAVVYVRQSTQSQVMTNLESQRRQYDLVDIARQHGFIDVEVVDDDLGRSASGTVARPGFDRLVAWLCAGKVGVVCARMRRGSREMAGTGTIFWNYVGLSKPELSTTTASTIPASPMTACFLA